MMETERELKAKLHGWALPEVYINRFIEEEYTLTSLRLLTTDAVKNLIPKDGPRAVFLHHFEQWKSQKPSNIDESHLGDGVHRKRSSQESQESDNDDVPPAQRPVKLSVEGGPVVNILHKNLQSNIDGRIVLAAYDAKNELDDNDRDKLAERVIFQELEGNYNKRIDKERLLALAKLIVELFPKEALDTWYDLVVEKKRSYVKGRLRMKFYNVRRMFIKCNLISKRSIEQELAADTDSVLDSELDSEDDDDEDDDFVWLKNHSDPYIEVEKRWTATRRRRKRLMSKAKDVYAYTSVFPALKRNDGWELLLQDALHDYPEFSISGSNWTTFVDKVYKLLMKKKDKAFVLKENCSDDDKAIKVLLHISTIFKVRALPKSSSAPKGTKCWRPSRAEVQDAFLLHIEDIPKLNEKLNERKNLLLKYHYQLQPIPVIVGTLENIKQCFVVLNNHRWEVPSPIAAIDTAFKIYYALNAKYPPEARHVWLYLQILVYKLTTATDYQDDRGLRSYMAGYFKDYEKTN